MFTCKIKMIFHFFIQMKLQMPHLLIFFCLNIQDKKVLFNYCRILLAEFVGVYVSVLSLSCSFILLFHLIVYYLSSESQDTEELVEGQVENTKNEVEIQTSVAEAEIPSVAPIENVVETVPEITGTFGDSNGQSSSPSNEESVAKGLYLLHAC